MSVAVSHFATQFNATLIPGSVGAADQLSISNLASLDHVQAGELTYADNADKIAQLAASKATAAFVPKKIAAQLTSYTGGPILMLVDQPQACFLAVLKEFRPQHTSEMAGIDPRGIISNTAKLGADCMIYPGVFIDAHAVIGDRCVLYPGVTIGPGCVLGDDVILYPQVVLYAGTQLGHRVIIHANAVIGADGFGYRFEQGRFEKLPHYGKVRVEDDVEIGACTTIDRAMISETVIGQGTKLDNLVMIGHNCQIGQHNVYASQVGLAGSITTGNYVRMGGQAGLKDHLKIGHGSALASRSGLMHDIPDGETFIGLPAGPEREQKKVLMLVQRLPEMRDQLKAMTKQVESLTQQIAALTSASLTPNSGSTDAESISMRKAG